MKAHTLDGHEVEISMDEAKRIAGLFATHTGTAPAGRMHYAAKTEELMKKAQEELKEQTGDFPETLEEAFEFAVKHKLFGDRADTHIYCNFFKVMFALLQQHTHNM